MQSFLGDRYLYTHVYIFIYIWGKTFYVVFVVAAVHGEALLLGAAAD